MQNFKAIWETNRDWHVALKWQLRPVLGSFTGYKRTCRQMKLHEEWVFCGYTGQENQLSLFISLLVFLRLLKQLFMISALHRPPLSYIHSELINKKVTFHKKFIFVYTVILLFFLDHAPLSKGLLVLTGTASFFNILFASSTKHFLPNNPWIQIAHSSKVLVNIIVVWKWSCTTDIDFLLC